MHIEFDILKTGLWAEGGKSWLENLKNDVVSSSLKTLVNKLILSSVNRYLLSIYYYWKGVSNNLF